jgi:hypothetical protein
MDIAPIPDEFKIDVDEGHELNNVKPLFRPITASEVWKTKAP